MHRIKDNIFVTRECLERFLDTGVPSSRISETGDVLYKELKERYRCMNAAEQQGLDNVVWTVERRIGKTTAIVRLAVEIGIPIVAERRYIPFLKEIAKEVSPVLVDNVKIIPLEELKDRSMLDGRRFAWHTVLVDEPTKVVEVRKALDSVEKYITCHRINILAIQ